MLKCSEHSLSSSWLAEYLDSHGRKVVGPVFSEGEEPCKNCLRERLVSCGHSEPGFTATTGLPEGLLSVLSDQAAYKGENSIPQFESFPPLPGCSCIRSRRRRQGDLVDAVSALFGPIRAVEYYSAPEGQTLAIARGATVRGTSGAIVQAVGSATDGNRDFAMRRAIAETLERYSAGFWSWSDIVRKNGQHWVWGKDCVSGESVLVPAASVFLPFDREVAADAGGLAAGKTAAEAMERALSERIERDIVKQFFAGELDALGKEDDHSVFLGNESGREVWMSLRRSAQPPYLALGFGSHRSRMVARNKSGSEALHVAAHMALLEKSKPVIDFQRIGWLDQKIYEFAFHEEAARQFLQRIVAMDSSRPDECRAYASRAVVEVTSPDVASYGLHVVRVVNL